MSPWSWLGCRGLIGFVFAGLYAVIEAWINAKATNANRGVLYALYQIANFAASGSGQLALKPLGAGGFSAFAVSGALLALAIVPMAMTSVDPPAQPRSVRPRLLWLVRKAPIPCFAVLAAGAANGALFALGPVFAVGIGMTPTSAPLFTSSIVLGSALGVLPIAAISDRIDRRLVIAAVTIAGAACETALSRLTAPGVGLIVLGFLVGLTTYSLYTLAVSLANDRWRPARPDLHLGRAFVHLLRGGDRRPGDRLSPDEGLWSANAFPSERLCASGHRGARPLATCRCAPGARPDATRRVTQTRLSP